MICTTVITLETYVNRKCEASYTLNKILVGLWLEVQPPIEMERLRKLVRHLQRENRDLRDEIDLLRFPPSQTSSQVILLLVNTYIATVIFCRNASSLTFISWTKELTYLEREVLLGEGGNG